MRHTIFLRVMTGHKKKPIQPLFLSGSVWFALPSGGSLGNNIVMDLIV